jgi:hypothetical protein
MCYFAPEPRLDASTLANEGRLLPEMPSTAPRARPGPAQQRSPEMVSSNFANRQFFKYFKSSTLSNRLFCLNDLV